MRPTRYVRTRSNILSNRLVWGLLAAFLFAALLTAYLTFSLFQGVASGNEPEVSEPDITPPPEAGPMVMDEGSMNIPLQTDNRPAPVDWDGESQVFILVMGLDARDWEGGGPSRTDTMILVSLDPANRSIGMLSIPRDLWVNIPGFDYAKINTAYFLGEGYQVEGGGPGLAMTTVENLLGVEIDYYAQVDFSAFESLISEIGGIEVDVPEEIEIDPIGPGNTVVLEAGIQQLDGPLALAYARSRNSAGNDFDRADRQHQVILAIRDRVLNLNMLPLLIQKAPILYTRVSEGIHTNLSLQQMINMAWKASQIPGQSIKRGSIDLDYSTMDFSWDGQSILLPNHDEIRILATEIFSPSGEPTEESLPETVTVVRPAATPTGDPRTNYAAENAVISVLNGTQAAGLAASTKEYLETQNIEISYTGNASEIYQFTTIIDYSGKLYTRLYLAEIMNVQASYVFSSYDPNADVDVAIILGNDWAASNPMQ